MAATASRNTQTRQLRTQLAIPMKAGAKVYEGCLVAVDATGYLINGATATSLIVMGVADKDYDNTSGSSGDVVANVLCCQAYMGNSGSDAVTQAQVGSTIYMVDNDTVSKTSATSTESAAGICTGLDAGGVWVSLAVGIV